MSSFIGEVFGLFENWLFLFALANAVIIHNFTLGEGLTFTIHHRVLPPMCTLKLFFYSQKVNLCKFLHCTEYGIFEENGNGCAFGKHNVYCITMALYSVEWGPFLRNKNVSIMQNWRLWWFLTSPNRPSPGSIDMKSSRLCSFSSLSFSPGGWMDVWRYSKC